MGAGICDIGAGIFRPHFFPIFSDETGDQSSADMVTLGSRLEVIIAANAALVINGSHSLCVIGRYLSGLAR